MSKQLSIPQGAEPWLVNLIELKNKTGITIKQIADGEGLAEKSVSNVFMGKSRNPSVNLIRRIIHALGGSWRDIFGESDAVIANQDYISLQNDVERLSKDNMLLKQTLNLMDMDNKAKKDKITALENELAILSLKLQYERKLNAVHNFYNKLIDKDDDKDE